MYNYKICIRGGGGGGGEQNYNLIKQDIKTRKLYIYSKWSRALCHDTFQNSQP